MTALLHFLRHPAVTASAYLLAWVLCGWFLWERWDHARREFDDPLRRDGNSGHVQIDFAGQWTMARLFVEDGRRLYHRDRQRQLVRTAFPADAERPDATEHDADALMSWFVGADPPQGDGIGGPLYPPVHGLLYAPLGQLDPQPAYRLFQTLSVGFAVFAGLAISRATAGRVWTPLAVVGVFTFPGARGGFDLGQNHTFTLAIVACGWWAMSRGRWVLGGAVWGLLALKPTWAVAFLPVPVLMGRWRASFTMCGTAAGLVMITLPVVGVQSWFDWLRVGREASAVYGVNDNWISFSRDLAGLPRRLLVDFGKPETERSNSLAAGVGWLLWSSVLIATAVIYARHRDRRPTGLAAGFLLLGAYLTCYRFMYYDAVLATAGVGLVVSDRRAWRWLPLGLVAGLYLYENVIIHYSLELGLTRPGCPTAGRLLCQVPLGGWELTVTRDGAEGRYAISRTAGRVFTLAGTYRYAWDTAFLLGLWAWVGWRLASCPAEGVEGRPDVGRPH